MVSPGRTSRAPHHVPEGPIRLTYEDYCELPEDGRRYEILGGELHMSATPPTSLTVSRRTMEQVLTNDPSVLER